MPRRVVINRTLTYSIVLPDDIPESESAAVALARLQIASGNAGLVHPQNPYHIATGAPKVERVATINADGVAV